jgi:hypothetical protein
MCDTDITGFGLAPARDESQMWVRVPSIEPQRQWMRLLHVFARRYDHTTQFYDPNDEDAATWVR